MLPNYATDLLHAHQIRRENVFLHKELGACHEDHAAIWNEIDQIQVLCNASNDNSRQAHAVTIIHQTQLQEQAQLISHLQDTNEALHNEFLLLSKNFEQFRCAEQHEHAALEEKVKKLEEDIVKTSETPVKSTAKIWDTLEDLIPSMDTIVERVIDRLMSRGLILRSPSSSTSCIVESIEQQVPSTDETYRMDSNSSRQVSADDTTYPEIQVQNSQKLATRNGIRVESFKSLDPNTYDQGRETTVPEEVDLDANAPTISYTGHYYRKENLPYEEDSLQMLPELSVQPSKLALINTLAQGRYEDWSTYHERGVIVRQSLPQTFETAILQRFVDGICGEIQRSQCLQWLGEQGWSWENVTRFGDVCSQMNKFSPSEEGSASTTNLRPTTMNHVSDGKSEEPKEQTGLCATSKPPRQLRKSKWIVATLRRSQRLIEKSKTKLVNDLNDSIDTADSRSIREDKCHGSHYAKEPVAFNERATASEMSKAPAGPERPQNAADDIITPVEYGVDGSSHAEMQSSEQEIPTVSRKRSRNNVASPDTIDLPPAKQSRIQSSGHAQEGRRRHLPIPTPPEIPILPTSTDV
ncbi:hypothetical protein LTR84_002555 [Exophiala bonariae]|uniref:Uncharacterized protein n=1 Tax=Exophiala bonariae TaxID=1690606 RepID=A0AAV9NA36_9EURO|nr:hypothetical protein LTR84_002555 [Exophiala bonariae]